jgi:hypothetical protein
MRCSQDLVAIDENPCIPEPNISGAEGFASPGFHPIESRSPGSLSFPAFVFLTYLFWSNRLIVMRLINEYGDSFQPFTLVVDGRFAAFDPGAGNAQCGDSGDCFAAND